MLPRRELRRAPVVQMKDNKLRNCQRVRIVSSLSLVQLICISKVCVERVSRGIDTESSDSLSVQQRKRKAPSFISIHLLTQ